MPDRPIETVRIRGEWTGSASVGRAVEVTRYTDTTLYDRYAASGVISPKQATAAEQLDALRLDAGLEKRVCGRYGGATGRSASDGQDDSRTEFHAALRLLTPSEQWAVMDLLWGSALPQFRIPTLRAALDVLVGYWDR